MPQECNFLSKDRAVGYHSFSEAVTCFFASGFFWLVRLQGAEGHQSLQTFFRFKVQPPVNAKLSTMKLKAENH